MEISVARVFDAIFDPTAPIPVTLIPQDDGYQLNRGGQPYFIKGVGGRRHIAVAAEAGANSVRTWGPHDAGRLLDHAHGYGMTVMLGIWLSHEPSDYLDPAYKSHKTAEIQRLLDNHKNHPALLMWSLGNEINLKGKTTPAAWQFVNQLACMIKNQDPRHPVITVIAYDDDTLNSIARHAPGLDAVGINAYGALSGVRAMIEGTAYDGPYIITEWGVDGHWEVQRTVWGSPIEPTSEEKARHHLRRYAENILANTDKCIGSYVFLWGQKQERTPTWYSMIIENLPNLDITGASCPTVDVMRFNWSGSWPSNRAPKVDRMTINNKLASGSVRLIPGEIIVARVAASDPENDGLSYVWELLAEPAVLGIGGSQEPRPGVLGDVLQGNQSELSLHAPQSAGAYRLFVYVLDRKGHVGTANFPFQVDPSHTRKVVSRQPYPQTAERDPSLKEFGKLRCHGEKAEKPARVYKNNALTENPWIFGQFRQHAKIGFAGVHRVQHHAFQARQIADGGQLLGPRQGVAPPHIAVHDLIVRNTLRLLQQPGLIEFPANRVNDIHKIVPIIADVDPYHPDGRTRQPGTQRQTGGGAAGAGGANHRGGVDEIAVQLL